MGSRTREICRGLNVRHAFCGVWLLGATTLVLILPRLICTIVLPGTSGSAVLTYKLFNVPVSFATTRPQVSAIVTRNVLPFVAHAAAHHRLPIILGKHDSAHQSDL